MSNAFTINPVKWQNAQQELTMLRTAVFIQEQNVSTEDEWDNRDAAAIHFLVSSADLMPIGCARLLTETRETLNEDQENNNEQTLFHIGRVAIVKEYRRQGIGKQLMQTIIDTCLEHTPSSAIYLHAQTASIKFYQQLGFIIQGNVFMDAGIPHIEMWIHPKKSCRKTTDQLDNNNFDNERHHAP